MTFQQIKEQEPEARVRVEALRQAIKDAEGLDSHQLVAGLRSQFRTAVEVHVNIFTEAINLPFEQYSEIVGAMQGVPA
jgi:hypothetical protein